MIKNLFILMASIISYLFYIKFYLKKINENQFLLLFFMIFILFFFCYCWYFKRKNCETYTKNELFEKSKIFRQLSIGLFSGAVAVFSTHVLYFVFEDVKFFSDRFNFTLIFYAIIFSFGASVMEEIVFRGLLQGALRKIFKHPLCAPLVIFPVACAFTYVHKKNLSDLYQARLLLVLMAGIILGMMAYVTNALWLSMGAHFTWNFFQEIAFGYDQKIFGKKPGIWGAPENAQIYSIIVIGFILAIWLVFAIKVHLLDFIKHKKIKMQDSCQDASGYKHV